jgi:hypothetical protein
VIVAPPLLAGAVKLTTTCALPLTPLTTVGTPGIVTGITEEEALEALLVPALLVAVTVKVYAVPLVRPVTVIGELLPVAVTAEPPPTGVAVTV